MVESSNSMSFEVGRNSNCMNCPSGVVTCLAANYAALFAEVEILAKHIDCTRTEIAVLSADEVVKSHVVTATDELDAIVLHTVNATTTILDACEAIDNALEHQLVDVAGAATAKIYEACSFQDITGQRVQKVVRTLQLIEVRISEILDVFGSATAQQSNLPPLQEENPLLSGPQKLGLAMNQGAVDALLDMNQSKNS